MAPEFDHLAAAMEEATAPICAELRARLATAPSEEDWLAIITAVAKAACVGVKRGAVEFSDQVEEALPAGKRLSWELDLSCQDLWAERSRAHL